MLLADAAFDELRALGRAQNRGHLRVAGRPGPEELADSFEGSLERLVQAADRKEAARRELHSIAQFVLGLPPRCSELVAWMAGAFRARALVLQSVTRCTRYPQRLSCADYAEGSPPSK